MTSNSALFSGTEFNMKNFLILEQSIFLGLFRAYEIVLLIYWGK
jgi:hypothetical protein